MTPNEEMMHALADNSSFSDPWQERPSFAHCGGGIHCVQLGMTVPGDYWIRFGDAAECWGCDLYQGEEHVASFFSDIPTTTNDARSVFLAFNACLTWAEGVVMGPSR